MAKIEKEYLSTDLEKENTNLRDFISELFEIKKDLIKSNQEYARCIDLQQKKMKRVFDLLQKALLLDDPDWDEVNKASRELL